MQLIIARIINFLLNDQHQALLATIDYLMEEVRILKSRQEKKIRFTDAERIRLAEKAKKLGKLIDNYANLVTPDTLYRWHRKMIANKFDGSKKRAYPGRPRKLKEIRELVVKMARENKDWGAKRIEGQMKVLGYSLTHQTVLNILKEEGMDPAPERSKHKTWAEFIEQHLETIWGCDFFTTEVWTLRGLLTFHTLFFIHLGSRKVVLGGITHSPSGQWCEQIAKEMTAFDGPIQSENKGYIIHDRASVFTDKFDAVFASLSIEAIKLPARSPNLNAFDERFVRSIKAECLNQLIFVGEKSLYRAITNYIEHHQTERCHQGLDNVIPFPAEQKDQGTGEVQCHQRLGGLLKSYRRAA